jgi:peptidoglycan/LPS O-acetylase OafA/YrhL
MTKGSLGIVSQQVPKNGGLGYRPEVDGLRAIAVVPVVLFHAGFGWFSGGYIGVDVFFVISGYLITSIILNEHKAGKFSIANFYERRARRILPPLFLVMLVSLPFAWFWMTPHHLKAFSQSMVAASIFAPNVYFFLKSGYFDLDSDEKPLLHTWSLGVEEQYYIAFPLLVLLCWRWGPKALTWLIAAIALISFGLSEWASFTHPVGNFYLAPTRAWELSLGSLLAIASAGGTPSAAVSLRTREFLGAFGLVLILAPIFFYDQATRFPSLYALPPTLGAALILGFADRDTFAGRLLSLRGAVAIGLISYSVYLWHQPLFAFARIYSVEKPSVAIFAALSVASVALGYLTWRFLEKPVRDKRKFSRSQIFASSAAGSMLFIGLGLGGHYLEGLPGRLTPEQQAIMAFGDDPDRQLDGFPGESCFLTPAQDSSFFGSCADTAPSAVESVVLWGDSHAAHLYAGLIKQLGRDRKITSLTTSSCPPIFDFPPRSRCRNINDFVLARITEEQPDRVILAAVWGHYDWKQLEQTLSGLRRAGIRQIDVIGPVPRWHPSLPVILTRFDVPFSEVPRHTTVGLDPAVERLDSKMKELAQKYGANYISPFAILCDANGCLTRVDDRIESMMHWDVSHLTRAGSEYLVSRFW